MGGNIFRGLFRYVDHVPAGARSLGWISPRRQRSARYTAAVEWVTDGDENLYLVGAWRERLDEVIRPGSRASNDARSPVTTDPEPQDRASVADESLPSGSPG